MTKLDVKTLNGLMLEASIQYPKNIMLHRALLSARNRMQEIELAKAADEPADADPDGASNVDVSKATDL